MFKPMYGGLGLFLSFGISLGALMFLLASGDDGFGAFIGIIILMMAVVLSPILATIVGAIISKNYDDEVTATWNGALVGALGTVIMVVISILVMGMAVEEEEDDPLEEDEEEEDGSGEDYDMLIKGLVPSAIGGALGAFVGFRFIWN